MTAMLHRALPGEVDLLALHRVAPMRYPLLLESATSHAAGRETPLARWDLLLMQHGEALQLDATGDAVNGEQTRAFFAALDDDWHAHALPKPHSHDDALPPFRGGWGLFFAYEMAAGVEPILRLNTASGSLPRALALRCPLVIARDHRSGACMIVAEAGCEVLIEQVLADLREAASCALLPVWRAPVSVCEDAPAQFTKGASRILDYLAAGDVFQVNLSRDWQVRFDSPPEPAALHARLRAHNPAPFAALLTGKGWAIASSSPERLVRIRGEVVDTRPIAGTRPRFEGDDDAERMRELVGHPKERAEHVMLVDLERNDIGRVSVGGSVEVDELMTVESYAHVHHIVSNVRGVLRADASPVEVIRAVFPGGTITGAPKVRCMQIIAELEEGGRGAYTGSIGWLNRDGDMDLNILIRSAELQGKTLRFRTGAGIVMDSVPQRELDETRAKARGLLRALGVEG